MNKKISIVMAYYNRKFQTIQTLDGFEKLYSGKYNFEVIIVDDNSNEEHKLNDIIKNYSYKINLIQINEIEKNNRINSCCVYNKGFKEVTGNIVIIQNPECLHIGDIIKFINENFEYDKYLSFPCYNSNNYEVNKYIKNNYNKININNIEKLTKDFNKDIKYGKYPVWYQHPIIRNENLHFCCAIDKEYLDILGGFNEKYKEGICFEDNSLVFNIKEILKLNVVSLSLNSNVGVVHLYHGRSEGVNINKLKDKNIKKKADYERFILNKSLYNYEKKINKNICIPKIFHYYWDDFKKFSYINLYSLKTSVYYHPDYIHIIWCPFNINNNITWKENENNIFTNDPSYNKYINEIKKMSNVRIINKNIKNFLNLPNNMLSMSEVHKSDLFRYKILYKYGGIWSDLDIIYIKSITDIINFDFDTINFLCKYYSKKNIEYYSPIGFLLAKKKNKIFKYIYNEALKSYDKNKYQCMGSNLLKKIISGNNIIKKNNNTYFINENNILLDENIYMIYDWTKIYNLFIKNNNKLDLSKTVGFHWFNGSNITKQYLKKTYNYTLPEKFKGAIFKNKCKFHKNITKIKYFDINIEKWGLYYKNKMKLYINILKNNKNILFQSIYIENYCKQNYLELLYNSNTIYFIDELSYSHLLVTYNNGNNIYKTKIENFISNANYICFFSELFKNDNLQTMGCSLYNLKFSKLFFNNCNKILLCNTKNINYLLNYNIFDNIIYFPPIGYSKFIKYDYIDNNKKYDILFYGNMLNFKYRKYILNNIKNSSHFIKQKIIITDNLYGDKKKILKNTKIVIHVPSHENLHTFPWAKVSELMLKKVFFIIEENEEMYIKGLDKICVFYKRNNITDLKIKLKNYLNNPNKRNEHINKCYNYFKNRYNIDKLFEEII